MKTGALILASFDQREPGGDSESYAPFLPMVPFEGSTVVKQEIQTLRKAGLSPIFVLAGHLGGVLRTHLGHHNVILLRDAAYEAGDLQQSLAQALQEVWRYCDRVISIPVEYPVFAEASVRALDALEIPARAVFQGKGELRLHIRGAADLPEQVTELPDEGLMYSLLEEGGIEEALRYARSCRPSNPLSAHTKVVLRKEEDFFGPGIAMLMEQIEACGSLQAAAAQMGMSYSKAWKMVNKAEKQLGFTLVSRVNGGKNGGSSRLTGEGLVFVQRYRALCTDADRMVQGFFDTYFGEFQ